MLLAFLTREQDSEARRKGVSSSSSTCSLINLWFLRWISHLRKGWIVQFFCSPGAFLIAHIPGGLTRHISGHRSPQPALAVLWESHSARGNGTKEGRSGWVGEGPGHPQGAEQPAWEYWGISQTLAACLLHRFVSLWPPHKAPGQDFPADTQRCAALGNLGTHLAVFSNTDRQGQSLLRRHYLICPSGAHSSSLCISPGTSSAQCAPQEDDSTTSFLFTVPKCQHQKPPVFSQYPFQTRD